MVESKPITDQLMKFNKILDDLTNIEVNMEYEDMAFFFLWGNQDKALLLLYSLPKSFKHVILYRNEGTTTLEEVQTALRTKELTKFKDISVEESGEGLECVKGKEWAYIGKKVRESQGLSPSPRGLIYRNTDVSFCHKLDYFKKDCPDKGAMVVLLFMLQWCLTKMVIILRVH